MRYQNILSILLAAVLFLSSGFAQADTLPIRDYHATFIPGYDTEGQLQIVIRMYYLGETPYFLSVDPLTLQTKIAPAADLKTRNLRSKTTSGYTMASLQETPYLSALTRYSSAPYLLQNDGLTHSAHPTKGIFLTVDMCPSSKPFEIEFFKTLVSRAEKTQHPIPIALSMSGMWMLTHAKELDWLIDQTKKNTLLITWMNHSFSHVYYRDLPLQKNFMLNRPGDFTNEVLETEKILLQKQQLPSVFFRYPGLVSNEALSLTLRELGLIPVGSDAWLAKGEKAKAGSIILVHGNSNEHPGIEKIMPLLQSADVNLLPLTESIIQSQLH